MTHRDDPREAYEKDSRWVHREISIFCGAQSHGSERRVLAVLRSRITDQDHDGRVVKEIWTADDRAEHQRVVPNEIHDAQRSDVTYRFKIVCPVCGDDLTVGDQLGRGYRRTILDAEWLARVRELEAEGLDDIQAVDAVVQQFGPPSGSLEVANYARLTKLADHGVSCLSLSALRATLSMR
jgi:hypothetical protein